MVPIPSKELDKVDCSDKGGNCDTREVSASGVGEVGNSWAQTQPILSGAQSTQPLIAQSKLFKKLYQSTIFAAKYEIHDLRNY